LPGIGRLLAIIKPARSGAGSAAECAAQSAAYHRRTKRTESRYASRDKRLAVKRAGQGGDKTIRRTRRGCLEGKMQILLVAFCTLAAIWLVVLWGSRYLGPQ
jgi:hypothetical protein